MTQSSRGELCALSIPLPKTIGMKRGIIVSMSLSEFHPLIESEIACIPPEAGVYILFQVQIPIHVDGAADLQKHLRGAKRKFPRATHFAVETGYASAAATAKRVEKLRAELIQVRAKGFIGSR